MSTSSESVGVSSTSTSGSKTIYVVVGVLGGVVFALLLVFITVPLVKRRQATRRCRDLETVSSSSWHNHINVSEGMDVVSSLLRDNLSPQRGISDGGDKAIAVLDSSATMSSFGQVVSPSYGPNALDDKLKQYPSDSDEIYRLPTPHLADPFELSPSFFSNLKSSGHLDSNSAVRLQTPPKSVLQTSPSTLAIIHEEILSVSSPNKGLGAVDVLPPRFLEASAEGEKSSTTGVSLLATKSSTHIITLPSLLPGAFQSPESPNIGTPSTSEDSPVNPGPSRLPARRSQVSLNSRRRSLSSVASAMIVSLLDKTGLNVLRLSSQQLRSFSESDTNDPAFSQDADFQLRVVPVQQRGASSEDSPNPSINPSINFVPADLSRPPSDARPLSLPPSAKVDSPVASHIIRSVTVSIGQASRSPSPSVFSMFTQSYYQGGASSPFQSVSQFPRPPSHILPLKRLRRPLPVPPLVKSAPRPLPAPLQSTMNGRPIRILPEAPRHFDPAERSPPLDLNPPAYTDHSRIPSYSPSANANVNVHVIVLPPVEPLTIHRSNVLRSTPSDGRLPPGPRRLPQTSFLFRNTTL